MVIQVSGQSCHLAQKNSFTKKLPKSKFERFLKANSDPNQMWKIELTQHHSIWEFHRK